MGQCPVTLVAVGGFEHDAQAELQRISGRKKFRAEHGVEFKAVVEAAKADVRDALRNEAGIALTIIGEAVGRPLPRWREIEFPVFGAVDRSNECFAAGVLPETIGLGRDSGSRKPDAERVARQAVAQCQFSGFGQRGAGRDAVYRGTVANGVAEQGVSTESRQGGGGKIIKPVLYLLIRHDAAVDAG